MPSIIERLWRSRKSECVYLHARETGSQAKAAIARRITFYDHQRLHTANGIETDQQLQAVA